MERLEGRWEALAFGWFAEKVFRVGFSGLEGEEDKRL